MHARRAWPSCQTPSSPCPAASAPWKSCSRCGTWGQLGYHAKPLGLLEVNGFYSKLGDFLDHLVAERFVRPQHREMLQIAGNPQNLLDALSEWRPSAAPKWVDRAPV